MQQTPYPPRFLDIYVPILKKRLLSNAPSFKPRYDYGELHDEIAINADQINEWADFFFNRVPQDRRVDVLSKPDEDVSTGVV